MENKYYLAVEIKPKNYFPIDILNLNISNGFSSTNLEELDVFTLKFTKEEILNSIESANLLDISYDMPLVIIYYEKKEVRRIPIITKDLAFDMWTYLKENYNNKLFLNKIDNFLNNKIEDTMLQKIKTSKSVNEWIISINNMPYEIIRKLYFYLYENQSK